MFSRVLTRNFFFRRGQHADGTAKHNKAAPRSRSASHERRETRNVLQPSSQNVVGAENGQTNPSQVANKELASKTSLQSMNEQVDEHDENSSVRFQPYVDPESRTETSLGDIDQSLIFQGCDRSLTPAVQDAITSFILVSCSDDAVKPAELDDGDDDSEDAFETPQLGSSHSEEALFPEPLVKVVPVPAETPQLGSPAFVEALFPEPAAITVRLPPPSVSTEQVDVALEAVDLPTLQHSASASADNLSLDHQQTSLDVEPRSLPTGLLSDITEEPSVFELSSKSLANGSLEVPADAHKADLSFASFGSSYANSLSADTSVVLPSELGSTPSTPTRFQEVMQNILAEAVASRRPNWSGGDVCTNLVLPPTVFASLPPSTTPAVIQHDCSPTVDPTTSHPASPDNLAPPSCTQPTVSNPVQQEEAIVACVGDEAAVKLPGILLPSTYADATNLALQYPEMSSRLLQEPLASAFPSKCPSATRSPSPSRLAVMPPSKKATVGTPVSAPVPKKAVGVAPVSVPALENAAGPALASASVVPTSGKSKKNKGPAHSKERPNWARAIEDLKADLQQRPRGRSTVVTSTNTHDEASNGKHINRQPEVDTPSVQLPAIEPPSSQPSPGTCPVAPEPSSSQPCPAKPSISAEPRPGDALPEEHLIPSKPDSQPTSPEKPPTGLPRSALRGERVALWLPRVRSWVQQTSSVDQTSPSRHNTPAGSLETSPSMALSHLPTPEAQPASAPEAQPPLAPVVHEVLSETKAPTVPRATPTTSPLNPLAPVWEFKPHQRAPTLCLAQPPSGGAPSINSPAASASHSPLPHCIEADLERLRIMLHDSGLEDRRFSAAQPHQLRSIWGSPEHAQAAMNTTSMVSRSMAVPVNVRHGHQGLPAPQMNFAAPPVNAMRQRTHTNNPPVPQASWQGVGSRPGFAGPDQVIGARGAPGSVSTSNNPPPVPYLSMAMSGLSPLSQMASRAALDAQPLGPRAPVAPCSVPAPLPPMARPRAGSVSLPMNQAIQFAHAGRHPGDPRSAPLPPPGSGRPWPPSATAGAIVPNTRFYGIETPLVVFDKHGWTVNNG